MSVRLPVVVFLGFLLSTCASRETLPRFTGKEYVPLAVGAYWEYSLTTTTINPVEGQVNTLTEIKLEVMDRLEQNGVTIYVIRRYTRPVGSPTYSSDETWSVQEDKFRYIQQEGNVPFLRLQFPLTDGKTWNGNAFNTLGGSDDCGDGNFTCDIYRVADLGKPFELPGTVTYGDTVSITEQEDDDAIVGKDMRKSVYARGIGLVYRERTHLEYCTVGSCIGQQVVENGIIERQILLTYGAQ
ncbi:MAG: hypothetical protein JNN04_07870 [Cyclobacteriaceae bacterium]|nr:hypothetical protein [Cyclobacteriaceae bacterium]